MAILDFFPRAFECIFIIVLKYIQSYVVHKSSSPKCRSGCVCIFEIHIFVSVVYHIYTSNQESSFTIVAHFV